MRIPTNNTYHIVGSTNLIVSRSQVVVFDPDEKLRVYIDENTQSENKLMVILCRQYERCGYTYKYLGCRETSVADAEARYTVLKWGH